MNRVTTRSASGSASRAAVLYLAETGWNLASRLYCRVAEWYRRSRSRRQLARFSPAMLRDLGITPAEREEECNKPFWRP
jgi:uncharacterized protein YjiS (DUF1127 family)